MMKDLPISLVPNLLQCFCRLNIATAIMCYITSEDQWAHPEEAMQPQTMKMPPPCFTDELVCLGS